MYSSNVCKIYFSSIYEHVFLYQDNIFTCVILGKVLNQIALFFINNFTVLNRVDINRFAKLNKRSFNLQIILYFEKY